MTWIYYTLQLNNITLHEQAPANLLGLMLTVAGKQHPDQTDIMNFMLNQTQNFFEAPYLLQNRFCSILQSHQEKNEPSLVFEKSYFLYPLRCLGKAQSLEVVSSSESVSLSDEDTSHTAPSNIYSTIWPKTKKTWQMFTCFGHITDYR